jgi:hypothetical protein
MHRAAAVLRIVLVHGKGQCYACGEYTASKAATDPDRFAAAGGIALGSTTDNANWTAGGIECFPAATNLVLTANGSNFTAGSIQISVQYLRGEAD